MIHFHLDLEDTVIEAMTSSSFQYASLLDGNIRRIRKYLSRYLNPQLHIFSFAIWNDSDRQSFKAHLQEHLERQFGLRIYNIPTLEEIKTWVAARRKLHKDKLSLSDMIDFLGKGEAFRDYIHQLHTTLVDSSLFHVLIDDSVVDETWAWPKQHVQGQLININSLED